jgi:hypothetical protein
MLTLDAQIAKVKDGFVKFTKQSLGILAMVVVAKLGHRANVTR